MRLPTLPKPPVPKRFQDKPAPPGHAEKAKPLDGIGQYLYPGRFSTPKNP